MVAIATGCYLFKKNAQFRYQYSENYRGFLLVLNSESKLQIKPRRENLGDYLKHNNNYTMQPRPMIKEAFLDAKKSLPYFLLMNGHFQQSRTEVLHHACTISVAYKCILLNDTYGFSMKRLYHEMLELFSSPSQLRLTGLIDLSSLELFVDSLNSIETKVQLLSRIEAVVDLFDRSEQRYVKLSA